MQAFTPSDATQTPQEIWRRLENLVRWGTIAQVDTERGMCRCATGDNTTTWIKWVTLAAGGNTKHWCAPAVGEQVIILSPGGEMNQAVALCGVFSEAEPQNGRSDSVHRTTYRDGTTIEYDWRAHALRISGPAVIRLQAQQVGVDGDLYVRGALHVEKSIRSDAEVMGVRGVWPPRPLQVPRLPRNTADGGIAP